jgi:hypothetical protein
MPSFDPAAKTEVGRLSLARAMSVLRAGSAGGTKVATQKDVRDAADTVQAGGRTVMSMDFYHARGGSAVPLPQAFFGRPSVQCGAGARAGTATLASIKTAAAAEGIKATPFAIKAAQAAASKYVENLEKLLKHDAPRSKSWTAAQVRRSASR